MNAEINTHNKISDIKSGRELLHSFTMLREVCSKMQQVIDDLGNDKGYLNENFDILVAKMDKLSFTTYLLNKILNVAMQNICTFEKEIEIKKGGDFDEICE